MTFVYFLYRNWLLVLNAIPQKVSHVSIVSLYLTQEDEHSEREHSNCRCVHNFYIVVHNLKYYLRFCKLNTISDF